VRRNGGVVDKFIGDSVMALYGVASAPEAGARQALLSAADMMDAMAGLNERLGAQLSETLRIGIGVHAGPAILGRIGGGNEGGITALGDTVNTASRLESATKELGATLVLSRAVAALAGVETEGWASERIAVRGRTGALLVHPVSDARRLRSALVGPPPGELAPAFAVLDGG